ECTCTGLDYTQGGSFLIDGSLASNFTFLSQFSSCSEQATCKSFLLGPDNREYHCTEITMDDINTQLSSCGIKYSDMNSGKWSIIIQAENVDFQVIREFELFVEVPERTTVVVTPTVVEGVTKT
ncbi:hypothetical protein QBC38DRAFT_325901, partial [Podospora fimiseda]